MPKALTPEQQAHHDRCYEVWTPTRKSRGVCEKAWLKYAVDAVEKKETTYDEIFERILAWNRYFKAMNTERRYIKLFETWIRNRGWRDDIPSASEARGCEIRQDRYFTPTKHKKSSPEVARDNLNRLRGMLK